MIRLPAALRRLRVTPRNVLWAAVVVAVALVGLVLYGQAEQDRKDARVDAVARYIREVNGVRAGLALELREMNRTYERFAGGGEELGRSTPRLEDAVRTMRTLRVRLDALEPPPEAADLHAEIMRLVELEIALAEEVRDIGRTLPRMAAEAERLVAAGRRLLRGLEASETLAAQATAFDRYGKDLKAVADRLSSFDAPPALEASVQSEVKRLRGLVTLANKTRDALAQERPADARRLSNQLAKAASETAVVTDSQREGIEAYGRRIREIRAQERSVETERERIAGEL